MFSPPTFLALYAEARYLETHTPRRLMRMRRPARTARQEARVTPPTDGRFAREPVVNSH